MSKHFSRLLACALLISALMTAECGCAFAETGWVTDANGTRYYDSNGNLYKGLWTVNGKLYFFDDQGYRADELGIDVSQFNYDIDWETVARQGIDFAIIRIAGRGWGAGSIYDDGYALYNLKAASAAGLKIGVYFYSAAVNVTEAEAEAEYTAELLNGIELDYPVYFDTEHSGEYPSGRADGLSPNQQAKMALAFCRRIEEKGYSAGIYSNENYFIYSLNTSALRDYSIWMASYTEGAVTPETDVPYDMWQFTETGTLDGVEGTVDFNVVYYLSP